MAAPSNQPMLYRRSWRVWPLLLAIPLPTILVAICITAVEWPMKRSIRNSLWYGWGTTLCAIEAGIFVLTLTRMARAAFARTALLFAVAQFLWLGLFRLYFACGVF